jgi:hypothetical protein
VKNPDNTVFLALPDESIFKSLFENKNTSCKKAKLPGYDIKNDGFVTSFAQNDKAECEAYVYSISYPDLRIYQKYINLCHYSENIVSLQDIGEVIVYSLLFPHNNELLYNDIIKNDIPERKREWEFIPDVHVTFPIEYDNFSFIQVESLSQDDNFRIFLDNLEERTIYESGVRKIISNSGDTLDFKSRIKRYYLGKVKIAFFVDTADCSYDDIKTYGQPAYADLMISIDEQSKCGVVGLSLLSLPFMTSVFLDNVVNNQIMVFNENRDNNSDKKAGKKAAEITEPYINLFDYLSETHHVYKRGTPKIYLTAPYPKDYLSQSQLASVLMAEMIQSPGAELGEIVDKEILDDINSQHGMGQYSRALVYANTNVLLQLGETPFAEIRRRLADEAVTYLYIELLMFEEASIETANNAILKSIAGNDNTSIYRSLMNTHLAFKHFTDTMVFWNIQMNYPSSKKSVEMIRKAFRINELIERFERNQQELQIVFDTKRDIIDRVEASILNYIILFLTIMQCLPLLFAGQIHNVAAYDQVGKTLIVLLLLYVYRVVKDISFKHRFSMNKKPGRGGSNK